MVDVKVWGLEGFSSPILAAKINYCAIFELPLCNGFGFRCSPPPPPSPQLSTPRVVEDHKMEAHFEACRAVGANFVPVAVESLGLARGGRRARGGYCKH